MRTWPWLAAGLLTMGVGCATQKESHTPRTGVEQLLISSAIDQSLDQVDLKPLGHRRVFLETKYLDCVDKNYIIVALHHRLLNAGSVLVGKPEEAEIIVEVGSGGVGTDSQEMFVGVPSIPLPPPSPISLPRMSLLTRSRLNGTAKLLVVAYDARTKTPVLNGGSVLARSDQDTWNVLGTGTVTSGSVPEQIAAATGETDFNFITATNMARRVLLPTAAPAAGPTVPEKEKEIETVGHREGN